MKNNEKLYIVIIFVFFILTGCTADKSNTVSTNGDLEVKLYAEKVDYETGIRFKWLVKAEITNISNENIDLVSFLVDEDFTLKKSTITNGEDVYTLPSGWRFDDLESELRKTTTLNPKDSITITYKHFPIMTYYDEKEIKFRYEYGSPPILKSCFENDDRYIKLLVSNPLVLPLENELN